MIGTWFLCFVLAVLAADLLTGVFHWLEDCYGLPTWPVVGEAVIQPNIDHHLDPVVFTGGTYWYRNHQLIIAAAVLLVPLTLLLGFLPWITLALALAAHGNEVHVWNHRKPSNNPRWVEFLLDAGLVQSRRQHAQHHKPPFTGYYCTLVDFNNAWLELFGVWPRLESFIEQTTGIAPKRMSPERSGV